MTTQQMTWRDRLDEHDFAIHGLLWQYLRKQGKSCFTADDLRRCFPENPPKGFTGMTWLQAFPDPVHDVGAWTAKAKMGQRLIIDTKRQVPSEIESNHGRRVTIFKMRGLQDRWEAPTE